MLSADSTSGVGGGGGGWGAVRFRPILRAGGGGGVLSACVRNTRFLDKRGGCKPPNPLKLRAKKRDLDKKGGCNPPPPPPPLYPPLDRHICCYFLNNGKLASICCTILEIILTNHVS